MLPILNRRSRLLPIAAALFPLVALAANAHADIFQWEYINTADPSQGKRQSTTLAPDGAGVDAVPGADLLWRNLTMAYLIGADLANATGYGTNLTDADLSHANLASANFRGATLTDADFTHAQVRGASFGKGWNCDLVRCWLLGSGIALDQLYSTASYQARDLRGIDFSDNDLAGGNFVGHNLTNANFLGATLTDADFTGAEIRATNFGTYIPCSNSFGCFLSRYGSGISPAQLYTTASYEAHDLTGVGLGWDYLNGANFAGQNLTYASFYAATLTDADFTDAEIRGANFGRFPTYFFPYFPYGTGITLAQLYSTASYQAHELSGVNFEYNNLAGANFAGQNLTNANFRATLTGADFTAADARGSDVYLPHLLGSAVAITINLIRPDGHINGLDLAAASLLDIRDYDGDSRYDPPLPPIPITVDQHLTMGPGGTLRMVFEADAWDSTISFSPGIPVALGGTLELTFAADVNPATQLGRTLKIFDWTGVNPTGAFAVSSPYAWDPSNLYTTGEVTLTAIPEPATIALAAVSAFRLTLYRRRKIS